MRGLLFLIFFLSTSLVASVKKVDKKKLLLKRKAALTSRITHKRLEKAFRYSRNKKNTKAIAELIKLLKQTKNRKYEYALVWQNLGFMLASDGQNEKAIKALENSLKLNSLTYDQTLSSLYTLAQIQFAHELFQKADDSLNEWLSYVNEPHAQAYMLKGMILGQLNQKEKALDYVNQAINMESKAQEKWLQYALSLNHSLQKYQNALKILITLTSNYPENKNYWKQLYQTYLSLHQDEKALAVMEMSYKEGHLDQESEIINMVRLMTYLKMPFKAAQILEKEIYHQRVSPSVQTYELLSEAWYQAREINKALEALDKAARKSSDGNIFAKKGYLLLESDQLEKAIDSFQKSITKGKVKDESKVFYALGVAHYSQKDLSHALVSLEKARQLDQKNKNITQLIDEIKNQKVSMNNKSLSY